MHTTSRKVPWSRVAAGFVALSAAALFVMTQEAFAGHAQPSLEGEVILSGGTTDARGNAFFGPCQELTATAILYPEGEQVEAWIWSEVRNEVSDIPLGIQTVGFDGFAVWKWEVPSDLPVGNYDFVFASTNSPLIKTVSFLVAGSAEGVCDVGIGSIPTRNQAKVDGEPASDVAAVPAADAPTGDVPAGDLPIGDVPTSVNAGGSLADTNFILASVALMLAGGGTGVLTARLRRRATGTSNTAERGFV